MTKNPLFMLCLFLFLRRQGNAGFPSLSSLQLESLIDQVHTVIHAIEKVNTLGGSDLLASLPDMKKMLEAVEKIPL